MQMKACFDVVFCFCLHHCSESHIGTIKISKEIYDAAWQQHSQIELPDQSTLLGSIPVLNSTDMLSTILTTFYGLSAGVRGGWDGTLTNITVNSSRSNCFLYRPTTDEDTFSLRGSTPFTKVEHDFSNSLVLPGVKKPRSEPDRAYRKSTGLAAF
jgi:hypothetical protein